MNFSTPTTPPAPNYGIKRRNSFYSPSLEFQNHNDGAHCTDDEHEGPQELTDPGPNVRSLYLIHGSRVGVEYRIRRSGSKHAVDGGENDNKNPGQMRCCCGLTFESARMLMTDKAATAIATPP